MRVKINVTFQGFVLSGLLSYCLLSRPNCRVISLRRVTVESVQILAKSIESVVTSSDSVWVKCRHYFEYIILPQQPSLLTSQIGYQVNCSVQNMGTWALAWMHSRGPHHDFLGWIKYIWPSCRVSHCIREQTLRIWVFWEGLPLICDPIPRGYRDHLKFSALS